MQEASSRHPILTDSLCGAPRGLKLAAQSTMTIQSLWNGVDMIFPEAGPMVIENITTPVIFAGKDAEKPVAVEGILVSVAR